MDRPFGGGGRREPMMLNHITLMIIFAGAVSLVFATLGKETLRQRALFSLWLFLGLLGSGLIIAWLMYPFPR